MADRFIFDPLGLLSSMSSWAPRSRHGVQTANSGATTGEKTQARKGKEDSRSRSHAGVEPGFLQEAPWKDSAERSISL